MAQYHISVVARHEVTLPSTPTRPDDIVSPTTVAFIQLPDPPGQIRLQILRLCESTSWPLQQLAAAVADAVDGFALTPAASRFVKPRSQHMN